MELKDAAVIELINTCSLQQRDTYFALSVPPSIPDAAALAEGLGARVIMLLPGSIYPEGETTVTVLNNPRDLFLPVKNKLTLADIRITGLPEFAEYLSANRFRFLLIPFYENALVTEYGYKFSYKQIGELRASLPFHLHVIAVSSEDRLQNAIFEAFGTRDYAVLGEETKRKINGVKADDPTECFRITAQQCEKYTMKQSIVLCPTRTAAERLQAYFSKRGTKTALFHGGREQLDNETALRAFTERRVTTLIATKSLIPSYPFIKADRLYYCGLPYSVAHADRCAALSKTGELICLWCEEDLITLRKLNKGFMEALQIDPPAFLDIRENAMREMVRLLER
jgi:hypothetical protein